MKVIKYILVSAFLVVLVGIFGRSVIEFPGSKALIKFGLLTEVIFIFIYGIFALIKKKNRIEAGMMGIAIFMLLGFIFKFMSWPGGGALTIIGSNIVTISSVGVAAYTIFKNRKKVLGIFYLSIGLGCLFLCFRIMRWPGSMVLFLPSAITVFIAVIVLIKQKMKMELSIYVSLILTGINFAVFFSKPSQFYRFTNINGLQAMYNSPEDYHTYAWILYKEGDIEEAKTNLKMAIGQTKNTENVRLYDLYDGPEQSAERYERALKLVERNQWIEIERAKNAPY